MAVCNGGATGFQGELRGGGNQTALLLAESHGELVKNDQAAPHFPAVFGASL